MAEITHMAESSLPEDCGGAFVGVYLRASDIRLAIEQAEKTLLEDKYLPVRIYEAVEIDVTELSENNEEYLSEGDPETSDLLNIYRNGGVWYTAFNTYPLESEQLQ